MKYAAEIVNNNPGCSIRFVAVRLHVGASSGRNNALGYNPVHRAIDAGLITAKYARGKYALYPVA
jgi:hypothetical protein